MTFVITSGFEPWDDPPDVGIMTGDVHWELLEEELEAMEQESAKRIVSFVKGLMVWDVEKRMKVDQVLNHPFINADMCIL